MSYVEDLKDSFNSLWVSDHFIPWTVKGPETPTLECWTTVSYLSGIFRNLDFGTIVLCNSYRPPALLAKMGAFLSAITGGRFILGIGAGWFKEEYEAYGYEFPKASVRIRQLEESVKIIKKMWTEDAPSFNGKYFKIEKAYCSPKPDPRTPIMIGGGGKMTLKVVAKHADWYNFSTYSPEIYEHKLNILKDHCSKVGRDYNEIKKKCKVDLVIGRDEQEAKTIAASNPASKNNSALFVGAPEQVVDRLKQFVKLDVEYFIVRFLDFPDTKCAELFSKEVIPKFK